MASEHDAGLRGYLRKDLLDSLSHLEPANDVDESLRRLLMRKARNDLLKYEVISRGFQKKYKMDFESFRKSDLMKEPPLKWNRTILIASWP